MLKSQVHKALRPDHFHDFYFFFEGGTSIFHRNLPPVLWTADQFSRQKTYAVLFDILRLRSFKSEWVEFEEFRDHIALEIVVTQNANYCKETRNQDALQASNVWQDIKNRVSWSLYDLLIEVHPNSDST